MIQLVRFGIAGILVIGTLTLTACGFTLRGTAASTLNKASIPVKLVVPNDANAVALKHTLAQQLQLVGIEPTETSAQQITISNLQIRRYELIGTLTEVRLVLMADVSYQLSPQRTQTVSLQVERSYQHNEASVVTLDQQGNKAQMWLYDDLARRIAEQYRALIQQN